MPKITNILATLALVGLLAAGCSRYDAIRLTRAALSGNPAAAAEALAKSKAMGYAVNPAALDHDIKQFDGLVKKFAKSIEEAWGEDEVDLPEPKRYVKYTDNYLSRALVDFDTGTINVETVDQENPTKSLKNAIVTTLLTPDDPRSVDLYSASAIPLGDTPFLLGEVVDTDAKAIRWTWRAERFADHLLQTAMQTRKTDGKTVSFVTIPMVRDHLDVRARKYQKDVEEAAQRFKVSRNLIYAIMKVESDFNPFAVSSATAIGLMQVVPSTAGADVYRMLHGQDGTPTKEQLFQPKVNITYGTGYLHMLDTSFLKGVTDPTSREYCVIAGYNGGAGSVLRTFAKEKNDAVAAINGLPPGSVYKKLRSAHPFAETRRYLGKVLEAKKHFVNF